MSVLQSKLRAVGLNSVQTAVLMSFTGSDRTSYVGVDQRPLVREGVRPLPGFHTLPATRPASPQPVAAKPSRLSRV